MLGLTLIHISKMTPAIIIIDIRYNRNIIAAYKKIIGWAFQILWNVSKRLNPPSTVSPNKLHSYIWNRGRADSTGFRLASIC